MQWIGIPRRGRWRVAGWCLAALAAACGGNDGNGGTGPGNDLSGTYQLVGANDDAVPAVVNSDVCGASQIMSGDLSLRQGGRWEMRFDWRDENGPQWTGDHGSYQRVGDEIHFLSEAWGDQFGGEIDDGLVWLYYDFCNDNQGEDLELAFSR